MIDISISDDFGAAGVAVSLGCIACAVEVRPDDEALTRALAKVEQRRTREFERAGPADVPEVAAARLAYRALGKDPARYRPSSEALMRRIAQGKGLYRINTVVDAGNLVSIHTGYPIGAYRGGVIHPPIVLRRAKTGESYAAIGRYDMNLEALPVVADARGPFGSPTSDSERTMIVPETQALLFVIYGFGDPGHGVARALDFAVESLTTFCAAAGIETAVVSAGPARVPAP